MVFLESLQENTGTVFLLQYKRFLQNLSLFIISPSPCRQTRPERKSGCLINALDEVLLSN
jgi:hypothetical protein